MKPPPSLDSAAIVSTFEAVPELKSAGALAGATALHHEHLKNRLGRFSRVEIATPYLRHRQKYISSRHVPGLSVVSLADLLFAKVFGFLNTRFAARSD